MTRSDMVGPRPLRPGVNSPLPNYIDNMAYPAPSHDPITTPGAQNGVMPGCRPAAPPVPEQPALVIVEKSIETQGAQDWSLAKALRDHADLMHKGPDDVTNPGGSFTPTFPHVAGTGSHVDVSTPQHDHARLQAKQVYLQERLAGHKNAGTPENHPDVQNHQRALNSVQTKIKGLESSGVKSGPEHHDDWMKHYSKNPEKVHSEAHVSAGLSAHTGFLGGPSVQKQRQQIASPTGSAQISTEMAPSKVAQSVKPRPSLADAMGQLKEGNLAQKGISLMLAFAQSRHPVLGQPELFLTV